ncbi:hypothetical protein BB560_005816 [Smittium megazygosporum]|uniref:Acyl-CoA desaturase n=1 Tax=Smittium megazygosporum TaxID=133381 RepID=A0A2T9YVG4_9FUNG|nr:hypothetical protein BB560_005816 [Smittium megazygosporum]
MAETIEKPTYKPIAFPKDDRPLFKKLAWQNILFLPAVPILALYGLFTTEMKLYTIIFAVVFGVFSGLGITAGYHRLWSHSSYKATLPLEIFLLIAGVTAVQESAILWCRHHRAHHRYTDTRLDPYNALKGFFYTHIGWLIFRKDRLRFSSLGIPDIKIDQFIKWQHENYNFLAIVFSFIVPTAICGYGWGDWRGGFYIASALRLAVIHQLTFCINSITHIFGTATFGDTQTSKDLTLVALLTFGEGYHNFHHEFPNDYGCTSIIYTFDITRLFIEAMAFLGLAYDLKSTPLDQVKKCYDQMKLKQLRKKKDDIEIDPILEKLPIYTPEEFNTQVKEYNKKWIIINDVICDVSSFIDKHPGGRGYIISGIGKDMSNAFNGGVYQHHSAAHNILSELRVGTIRY